MNFNLLFKNRCQEDFQHSNLCVAAQQNLSNAMTEGFFVISLFIVLNFQSGVH